MTHLTECYPLNKQHQCWSITRSNWFCRIQKSFHKFFHKFFSKNFHVQKKSSTFRPKLGTISEMAGQKESSPYLLYILTIILWPAAIEKARFWNFGRNLWQLNHIFTSKINLKYSNRYKKKFNDSIFFIFAIIVIWSI